MFLYKILKENFFNMNKFLNHSFLARIQRSRGNFGAVRIHWQIVYNDTLDPVPEGSEFEAVAGSVEFADQQTTQRIQVTSRSDGVPEFAEYYQLVLVNVSGKYRGFAGQSPCRPPLLFHEYTKGIFPGIEELPRNMAAVRKPLLR